MFEPVGTKLGHHHSLNELTELGFEPLKFVKSRTVASKIIFSGRIRFSIVFFQSRQSRYSEAFLESRLRKVCQRRIEPFL